MMEEALRPGDASVRPKDLYQIEKAVQISRK